VTIDKLEGGVAGAGGGVSSMWLGFGGGGVVAVDAQSRGRWNLLLYIQQPPCTGLHCGE
jgi:hypothetical protein